MPVDFVLVYHSNDDKYNGHRSAFEKAMIDDGLNFDREARNGRVFVKVTASFQRLAKEAERICLEVPLKGCEILKTETNCCRWFQNLFMTDDEVDFVSAPFQQEKLFLFEGHEDPETFFRSSLRSFLVHHILINLDIGKLLPVKQKKNNDRDNDSFFVQHAKDDIVSRIGLPYLLMRGAYLDAFPLHEPSAGDPYVKMLKNRLPGEFRATHDSRKDLNHTWLKFNKFQPLWKIRNYFGEKIAFYFAWQGTLITLLWIPAVLGVCVFGYGVFKTLHDNPLSLCRPSDQQSQTTNSTILYGDNCTVLSVAQFLSEDALDVVRKSFDNVYTPFFAFVMCIWGVFFTEIWKRNHATLSYQWDVDTFQSIEPDRPEFVGSVKELDPVTKRHVWIYPYSKKLGKLSVSAAVVFSAVLVVFASVIAVLLFKLAMKVRYNCTKTEDGSINGGDDQPGGFPTCLFVASILPSVLNGLSIMLFGYLYTHVADILTRWENHRTQSDYNNSLIIKLFAFQYVNTYSSLFYIAFFRPEEHGIQINGVFGMGPEYADVCKRGSCMSLLSLQVLVLMLFKPFPKLFMDIIWPFMKRLYIKIMSRLKNDSKIDIEPESLSTCYIEREYYKPAGGDFTLAEYSDKVIQFGYIMMFSASFPLAPFLALIINVCDLRVDARRLLWFNRRPVAFIAGDIGMWFPIIRFVTFCGVASNAFIIGFTSSFCEEFFSYCSDKLRLEVVVAFEHLVLFCMYLISVLIPDIPEGIKLAQRRQRYEVSKLLEDAGATKQALDQVQASEVADEKLTKSTNEADCDYDERIPNVVSHKC